MMRAERTRPVARMCRTCMTGMIQPIRRIDRLNAEVCSHWTYSIMVIFAPHRFTSHPDPEPNTSGKDVRRGVGISKHVKGSGIRSPVRRPLELPRLAWIRFVLHRSVMPSHYRVDSKSPKNV